MVRLSYTFNKILNVIKGDFSCSEYCYFWFHSEVKFLMRFRHLFGLKVILPYFNAISVDFYAVKCLIYIYFVLFPCLWVEECLYKRFKCFKNFQ